MTTEPTLVGPERSLSTRVETLAGFGFKAADIAILLRTEASTITDDYADDLARGALKANARIIESLFRKATGEGREAVTAAIFWPKARADWKERSVTEVVRPPGDPMLLLMQRIAAQGRRIHDRPALEADDRSAASSEVQ